jgi:hypothetical protein
MPHLTAPVPASPVVELLSVTEVQSGRLAGLLDELEAEVTAARAELGFEVAYQAIGHLARVRELVGIDTHPGPAASGGVIELEHGDFTPDDRERLLAAVDLLARPLNHARATR